MSGQTCQCQCIYSQIQNCNKNHKIDCMQSQRHMLLLRTHFEPCCWWSRYERKICCLCALSCAVHIFTNCIDGSEMGDLCLQLIALFSLQCNYTTHFISCILVTKQRLDKAHKRASKYSALMLLLITFFVEKSPQDPPVAKILTKSSRKIILTLKTN